MSMIDDFPGAKQKPSKRTKPRKRVNKVSPKDVPRLKRKLWGLVKWLCKRRDGPVCVSCRAEGLEGRNWHPGHWFTAGGHGFIEFHPRNIHSQCGRCNIFLRSNAAAYSAEMVRRYGLPFFEAMDKASMVIKQWKHYELSELIQYAEQGIEAYTQFYETTYGPALYDIKISSAI